MCKSNQGKRISSLAGLGLIALLSFGQDSAIATEAIASPAGSFCRPQILKDYLRPLDSLPKSKNLPQTGRLRFGPSVLRIYPPRDPLVLLGRTRFSLAGSLTSGGTQTRRLKWWSVSRLERITNRGDLIETVKAKRQYIAKVSGFSGRDFGFGSAVEPGLYRVHLGFETRSGRALGAYEEFYRAVEPESKPDLAISSRTFMEGATGNLRVMNLGTVDTTYSYIYKIWRIDGSSRTPVPLEPIHVSADRPKARAGMAGRCFSFKVPSEIDRGLYEIGVRVNNSLLTKARFLLTRFSIVS